MIKRIIKRIKIERIRATFNYPLDPPATLMSVIKGELFAFWLRRRAGSLALALACGGSLQRRWEK